MTKVTINEGKSAAAPRPSDEPVNSALVKDIRGRRIDVRRIGAIDRYRLAKMLGAEASQNPVAMGYGVLAYSVTALGADEVLLPQTERELEVVIGRLGDEGLAAVGEAHVEYFGISPMEDEEKVALKN